MENTKIVALKFQAVKMTNHPLCCAQSFCGATVCHQFCCDVMRRQTEQIAQCMGVVACSVQSVHCAWHTLYTQVSYILSLMPLCITSRSSVSERMFDARMAWCTMYMLFLSHSNMHAPMEMMNSFLITKVSFTSEKNKIYSMYFALQLYFGVHIALVAMAGAKHHLTSQSIK